MCPVLVSHQDSDQVFAARPLKQVNLDFIGQHTTLTFDFKQLPMRDRYKCNLMQILDASNIYAACRKVVVERKVIYKCELHLDYANVITHLALHALLEDKTPNRRASS